MKALSVSSRPPLWREARVGLEAAALIRDPILRGEGLRDGRGRPALLIPGFMAGDGSLAPMGNWLRRAGYRPSRAGMRVNVGCAGAGHERLEQRLERLVAEQGQRAVVIGQSRGGSMAKVLAVRRPDLVCGLVTLGSPHVDPLAVHPFVRLGVEAVSRLGSLGAPGLFKRSCLDGECCASFWADLSAPLAPDVGFVAVYSRSDGIVDWRACLDPAADEQVEIGASHCGMAVSPAAWRAVAKSLERFNRSEARRRPAKAERERKLRRVA
jgi:pimeloyl-ACP methyl ester carboxylesterase